MDDKEVFNPQSGERIAPKKPKKFWKDWRFYVYTIIAVMLAIVSVSSMVTACAAINAGVGQSEPVSSSYKVKHNAKSTTENGGYDKYTFAVQSWLNGQTLNTYSYRVYHVDYSTYTLSFARSSVDNEMSTGFNAITQAINDTYNSNTPSTSGILDLLVIEGYTTYENNTRWYWYYFTFVSRQNPGMAQLPFYLLSDIFTWRFSVNALETPSSPNLSHIILNSDKSESFFISDDTAPANGYIFQFQDMVSYLKEEGYNAGYSQGHTSGYAEGYDAGETHAYDTLQTGIAFETYGMYADAKITLVADRTEGSYSYMDLFDYVTDTNIERSVYVLYIQNASNSTWLGYVQDVNASDSSGATYDIGSFTGATSTTDVAFTALMDRNLWEGAYITSFHGHAGAVNNAFWFTGGSYAATQQIYQDGYGEGYDVGRNDGYDIGYDAGVQVGRVQGLNEAEPESLTNTLVAVFQQPFNQLYRFFNFNVLGLNVLGIVSGLVSVLVVVKVFRKLYK